MAGRLAEGSVVPVSVLVLARNEEISLPRCLASVAWSTDVVVLDDGSVDRSVELAQASGARVVSRKFDTFAGQRNWALDTVDWRNEWVLHLDADEVVPAELAAEIGSAIHRRDVDAYRIASKLIFMGRWLKHAATYPAYQVRLGRNPGLRFKQVGHGQREDLGPERIGTLRQPYLHFSFSKGMDEWLERHIRYAAAEALERTCPSERLSAGDVFARDRVRRRRALKRMAARLPFRPAVRFFWAYVAHGGCLDGRPGLVYCNLMAIYEAMISAKAALLRAECARQNRRQPS